MLGIVERAGRALLINTVSPARPATPAWDGSEGSLFGQNGERKYLNKEERERVLAAIAGLDPERALFSLILYWTGARISEVLALTPRSFQMKAGVVTFITLKRRKHSVRQVPVPPEVMAGLERVFSMRHSQRDEESGSRRVWRFSRTTGWRIIKKVMRVADVWGRQACPRGMRHGFGVGMLQEKVPANVLQRWMGHARISTTNIYLAVCGPDEIAFARDYWRAHPVALRRLPPNNESARRT